jgi:hypothetical protein
MPKGATMIISYTENGISKQREATADEIAYIESVQAEMAISKAKEEADKLDIANRKEAIYLKLGLTAEEIAQILS